MSSSKEELPRVRFIDPIPRSLNPCPKKGKAVEDLLKEPEKKSEVCVAPDGQTYLKRVKE